MTVGKLAKLSEPELPRVQKGTIYLVKLRALMVLRNANFLGWSLHTSNAQCVLPLFLLILGKGNSL